MTQTTKDGRTAEVAGRFGLSPARVSQLRRAFAESWREFHRGRV